MRKYLVAHSFLMFTSILASEPFYIVRRQSQTGGIIVGQSPVSNPPTAPSQSSASLPPPALPTVTTNSVTTPSTPPAQSSSPPTLPASTVSSTSSTSVASASSNTPTSSSSSSIASVTQDPASTSVSTDAQGSPVTITVAAPTSDTATSASASPTGSPDDSSIRPGAIIGLSVAGGVAAIAIIGFIVWKLTRKRFSDLEDPDEAIKWPELNRDSQVGGGNEGFSNRLSSTYSSTAPSRNQSALDQSEVADPYAVPPLPQFNPNQPYRDDPHAASSAGYYDPYRGPIPQTFNDGSLDGHESIPMNTYPPNSRGRSPGPGVAYDMGGRGSPVLGRASPAFGQAYDVGGRGSPAPGRTISPGPAAALGLDRRPSPGPQYAYGGQPEMAARNRSPGPNVL